MKLYKKRQTKLEPTSLQLFSTSQFQMYSNVERKSGLIMNLFKSENALFLLINE